MAFPELTLEQLRNMMMANGVSQLLVKELAANDNAKNQLYLAGNLDAANILPIGELRTEITDKGNKSLKAPVPLYWLQPDGGAIIAPGAQIILYPQYPEIRLSGFLRGALNAPNEILNNRGDGRLFFLGITRDRRIIGFATGPEAAVAKDYRSLRNLEKVGVFFIVPLRVTETSRDHLLREIRRIHELGWIDSKRLDASGFRPCNSPHCVGYTLEAELGILNNGKAEPDFEGWEIKAETVRSFGAAATAKPVTLMTPEPTGGFYRSDGVEAFVRKFGYPDKKGRPDRINFGGVYRVGERNPTTNLTLVLSGFDPQEETIIDVDGSLSLLADDGEIAAQWSFAALLTLWSRKHALAAYVPTETRRQPQLQYRYNSVVRLAQGTNPEKLFSALAKGTVRYDPAIKIEQASTAPRTKRRSQFRISSRDLGRLYVRMETVNAAGSQAAS